MMLDWAAPLGSAFVLGLLGGGHCLGMCGGLMGALTLSAPQTDSARRFRLLLGYNLGRLLSYSLAGGLLGLAGWGVASTPAVSALRVVAALLLVTMGLYLAGWWQGLTRIEALGRGLWRHLQPWTRRWLPVQNTRQALAVGMLWGWLPCGLVYSTLLWSASQGNALLSAATMAAFGLGTWPVMLATGLTAQRLRAVLRARGIRAASGVLVILFGLWALPGPHQAWLMQLGHSGPGHASMAH